MNFKAGDRVKIVGGYSYIPDGVYGEYGRIHLVDECDAEIPYYVKLDKKVEGKSGCWATADDLEAIDELAEKEKTDKENTQEWKIIITATGDKTTAILYALGRVMKEVAVTRYYKDECMAVAAKEAVNKLFKPQEFTGRAMFVGDSDKYWGGLTRGKIYCFTDGICVDDNGDTRCATTLEPDDWGYGDFIKVVE